MSDTKPQSTDDKWCYTESAFLAEQAAYKESLFAIGNGYLGVRGYFDEGYGVDIPNTACSAFLNGVYESLPIDYDESAYGFAKNCHRIADVPRHKFLIEINGIPFAFHQGSVQNYRRSLHFKTGTLSRSLQWITPGGQILNIRWERTALSQHKNIMLARLRLEAVNFSGNIKISSALNAEYPPLANSDDPRKGGVVPNKNWHRLIASQNGTCSQYLYQTKNSGISVAVSMLSNSEGKKTQVRDSADNQLIDSHQLFLVKNQPTSIVAIVSYADSRSNDFADYQVLNREKVLANYGSHLLDAAFAIDFDALMFEQQQHLEVFWEQADIQITGDDGAQFATRFALFHLYQSTGQDGLSSVAAKGVSGSGYDGHYFWDAETYVFPFWLFSHPIRARQLLEYRVNTLPAAKKRAREMGHSKGALYAWRTIGGEECSSYFPAGSAQYHINADIAYAAQNYIRMTGDLTLLKEGLAETVLETARIWLDLGQFSEQPEPVFKLFCVTGPDEYTALVNNNFYTNKMAQVHLRWAIEMFDLLIKEEPQFCHDLLRKISLSKGEMQRWQKAADQMYFCHNEEHDIYAQDESFLQKPVWDFTNTPSQHYPLLLHYHPLVIYRHQVLKQADVMLALLLAGESESNLMKRNCFEYYEPITTHDSTLSGCVYGIMAAELGLTEKAKQYFTDTLTLDLDDKHNNTYYGIHTAAMGGLWMSIVQGFGGLRYGTGKLIFNPILPRDWQALSFKCHVKGCVLKIEIEKTKTILTLVSGDALNICCYGLDHYLIFGSPLVIA